MSAKAHTRCLSLRLFPRSSSGGEQTSQSFAAVWERQGPCLLCAVLHFAVAGALLFIKALLPGKDLSFLQCVRVLVANIKTGCRLVSTACQKQFIGCRDYFLRRITVAPPSAQMLARIPSPKPPATGTPPSGITSRTKGAEVKMPLDSSVMVS